MSEPDAALWGPAPTQAEIVAAETVGWTAIDAALERVLADALSREEAATILGISPQAVSKRLAARQLVALRRGREYRLPAWQFADGDVLPGLGEVILRHPGGPLALTEWATSTHPDLDGRTPASVLRERGGIARVTELLDAVAAATW